MSVHASESQRICPRCRWVAVRLAMRRTHFDWIFRFVSLQPFRCRSCRHRFYRFRLSDDLRARLVLYATTLVSTLRPQRQFNKTHKPQVTPDGVLKLRS
jgi:hypothetical protein